ncbi:patatin-like phospholipase family protein [Rhodoferax sp.]|uniref:patatin-like phospholipase family protein n=1 Tax=Rhodoferax sp. TaxID=50421 RepID=UPI00272F124E|nr:patatin-like phospholipase family protein [Rhodoferax sp.]MDP1531189.1 patatin-like phospholipase family protein [Rhodoferax sp.]MDP1942239.1 patatin-like phospholipase family protein [Rhodoferax sp.]MDP2441259.1 patatin-like phospholipase family protein [Rhodoferax sp.]MDZ4207915.1 patatin-like phospholipase family protein [Rhodoferax sp.]
MNYKKTGMAALGALLALVLAMTGCSSTPPTPPAQAAVNAPKAKPVIALALGGGAAKGFAHIGVIKALEAQGIVPDIVIGTSAGSLVGALYASGKTGFELQEMAIPFDKWQFIDWGMPNRGLMKGDALTKFVNAAVGGRAIEKFPKKYGAVATDLQSGEPIVFRSGDAGIAVLASSSVPLAFQPVTIRGRQYVDGGLTSPVPVRLAHEMGASFVIGVDISDKPANGSINSTMDVALQTLAIMGQMIRHYEQPVADIMIRPDISRLGSVDFDNRHQAILEGERAAGMQMQTLKDKLARFGQPS